MTPEPNESDRLPDVERGRISGLLRTRGQSRSRSARTWFFFFPAIIMAAAAAAIMVFSLKKIVTAVPAPPQTDRTVFKATTLPPDTTH